MRTAAIVTKDLVKRYGRTAALNGFSLTVSRGSVMGLVGENGAGKTTWMMTLAGLVLPDAGQVDLLGRGPFDAAHHGGRLSILPQDSELPLDARVRELLIRYAQLQGLTARAASSSADSLLAAFQLTPQAAQPIRALSHGMRKRVMVAQAFIGDPDIVLLDEPLSGLDPVQADRMRAFIRARRGRQTIVISSHHLDDIEKLCTHVAFVERGRLLRLDTLSALTSASGRIIYTLRAPPAELEALQQLCAGVDVRWCEQTHELTVECDAALAPEFVNQHFVPHLLSSGLVSVTVGQTLEEAYLGRKGRLSGVSISSMAEQCRGE